MSVYVDNMGRKYGRMIMCHMIADTTEELCEMADRVGVARKWIQKANTPEEHFDIGLNARSRAIYLGAKEITQRELAQMLLDRKRSSPSRRGNRERK